MVRGNYQITKLDEHFELFRTTKPGFRALVDLESPQPEIEKIQWIDPDVTEDEKNRSIAEAHEYLNLFVLMGE